MPSQEPLANHSLQEGVVLSRHWQFGPYQSTHIYQQYLGKVKKHCLGKLCEVMCHE